MISRNQHRTDIWPGFVDALAALLMVIIFLLMVFVIAQFFLNDALTGRDEALERLQVQVSNLADLLSLERQANEELRASTAKLSDELQASISISDGLKKQVKNLKLQAKTAEELAANLKNELALSLSNIGANVEIIESQLTQINALRNDVESLKALREELEEKVTQLLSKVSNKDEQLITEKKLSQTARAQIALLNKQVTALRKQILQIANILEASEKIAKQRRVKIANLGKRLNAALASKVQELARYRSEFFGRLRDVLGSQPGIRIVGDRFVFQSEVLFDTASSEIQEDGKSQLQKVAQTLQEISTEFPTDLEWILRIDGHTDERPIQSERFASNWELSTARAISVVKFFLSQGIDPKRLAAAGFGSTHPITEKKTEKAYRQNRRIEIKLTQH